MKSMGKFNLFILIILFLSFFISGCADQVTFSEAAYREEVGFWYGLWHGIIMPIAWLISLFDNDAAIYAIYNNGGWYDSGYLLGIMLIIGGGASAG